MNYAGKEPRGARVHVLDRIDAEAVQVSKGDPEFVNLAEIHERGRNNVLVNLVLAVGQYARAVTQVSEREEVAIQKLREIVEIVAEPRT